MKSARRRILPLALLATSLAMVAPAMAAQAASGGHYKFIRTDGPGPVVHDECILKYAIRPGRVPSSVPYVAWVQEQIGQIATLSGTHWQYLGLTQSHYRDLSVSQQQSVIVIDLDATRAGAPNGSTDAWGGPGWWVTRNGQKFWRGGSVSFDWGMIAARGSARVASIEPGLGHELGHVMGLDHAPGGVGEKMGPADWRLPWGPGDRIGLNIAGSVSRDPSRCWNGSTATTTTTENDPATVTGQHHSTTTTSTTTTMKPLTPQFYAPLADAYYASVLGRRVDVKGALYWETLLANRTMSGDDIVRALIGSSESRRTNGSVNGNAQWIQTFYANALCRTPSSAQAAYWLTWSQKYGLASVAERLGASDEAKQKRANTTSGRICG